MDASFSTEDKNSNYVSYRGAVMSMTQFCEWMMKDLRYMGIDGVDYPGFSVNTVGTGMNLKFEIAATESFKKRIMSIHSHPVDIIVRFVELFNDSFGVFVGSSFYAGFSNHREDADEMFTSAVNLDRLLGIETDIDMVREIDFLDGIPEEMLKIDEARKSKENPKLNLLYEDKMFYPDWFTSRDGYTPQTTKFDSTADGAILAFAEELMKMNVVEIDECERVRTDSSDPRVVDEFLTRVKTMLQRRKKERDYQDGDDEIVTPEGHTAGFMRKYEEYATKQYGKKTGASSPEKTEHFEIEDYSTDEEPFESYPDGTVNQLENVGSQIEKPVLDQ